MPRYLAPVIGIPRQVAEAGVVAHGHDRPEHVITHPSAFHEPIDQEARLVRFLSMVFDGAPEHRAEASVPLAQEVTQEVRSRKRSGGVN